MVSQVMSVALNHEGTRAVTASKDGTLRVWNLAVRYHMRVRHGRLGGGCGGEGIGIGEGKGRGMGSC